jgi:hypothetical protein
MSLFSFHFILNCVERGHLLAPSIVRQVNSLTVIIVPLALRERLAQWMLHHALNAQLTHSLVRELAHACLAGLELPLIP